MAHRKIHWAVLGVANIATSKVIPGMRACALSEVVGIASRDRGKAERAARDLELPKAYGRYEDALADPDVDVIYNALPNHLHVPWSIRAIAAGKHVLCEKPIAISVDECRKLIAARDESGVQVGEAFMIRTHPQWIRVNTLVRSGAIGNLRAVAGMFSYFNRDPKNIRNLPEYGGGALWDIGCYLVLVSRMLFGEEPISVAAMVDRDPSLGIDRLTSALLCFPGGHCTLTCSTQLAPYQRIHVLGDNGRIEVEIPFNAPADRKCRIFVQTGRARGDRTEVEEFDVCDQYGIQADHFSLAALGAGEVATSLEDSVRNVAVIEAIFESARTAKMVRLNSL